MTALADLRARAPIKLRIARALVNNKAPDYYAVMREVFPPEHYPRAWRVSSNGGPPGCAMAFGCALRELGVVRYETGQLYVTSHAAIIEVLK